MKIISIVLLVVALICNIILYIAFCQQDQLVHDQELCLMALKHDNRYDSILYRYSICDLDPYEEYCPCYKFRGQ